MTMEKPQLTAEKIDALLQKYGGFGDELILVGVRDADNPQADSFNDWVGYATKDAIELFVATTDPGLYWTFNQINPPHGAAHYEVGFHKDLFAVGPHYDQDALRQVGNAYIWRDDNKNFGKDESDFRQFGRFGMNMHHAKNSPKIYNWSAGCQVLQSPADLAKILAAVRATAKYKANPAATFSYLLVNKEDL